jgi:hypothetical protein
MRGACDSLPLHIVQLLFAVLMQQSGFTPGDVVGIELDLDNDNIRFLVNGKVSKLCCACCIR